MKKIFFVCSILLVGLVFSSCNKSEEEPIEKGNLRFTYQGKTYETSYKIVKGEKIYDNEEVANIYSGLLDMKLFPLLKTDNSIVFFKNYEEFCAQVIRSVEGEPPISRKSYTNPATTQITVRLFTNTYLIGNTDYNYFTVSESVCKDAGFCRDYARSSALWPNCWAANGGAKSVSALATKTSGADWESYATGYVVLTDANVTPLMSIIVNLNGGAAGNVDLTTFNLPAPVKLAEVLATYF